jgi:hypothetical protein
MVIIALAKSAKKTSTENMMRLALLTSYLSSLLHKNKEEKLHEETYNKFSCSGNADFYRNQHYRLRNRQMQFLQSVGVSQENHNNRWKRRYDLQ